MEFIRDILDAVHIEAGSPTIYSNVYDLKNRTIYLYHYHDYENVKVFRLDEELAKGYHAYVLADLFPENPKFQDWAKPRLDWIEKLRAEYQPIEVDTAIYDSFMGNYDIPAALGLPYPFYSIAFENDTLYLQIKTDKAWLDLLPLSETSYYHVSSFAQFEITFIQDENGQVNQFLYQEKGKEYVFDRITEDDSVQVTVTPSPLPPTITFTSTPEPHTPTSTPVPHTATPIPSADAETTSLVQPTEPSLVEESDGNFYCWALPIFGLVLLLGWFIARRSKT